MCGRYSLNAEIKRIMEHFNAGNQLAYSPGYNTSPSHYVPAVRSSGNNHELFLCHWGLIPHWSRPDNKYRAINARAETLTEKPYFRDAFKKRRCLIPATGFYEWKKEGNTKQPYYFHLNDNNLFAFAGLWEYRQDEDKTIESCTIITTKASDFMKPYHERMPVIIDQENYDQWLETGGDKLLVPYTGDIQCHPVSRQVNNPKNNCEDLIKAI